MRLLQTCSSTDRAAVTCQDLIRLLLVIHVVIVGHVLIRRLHCYDAVLHQPSCLHYDKASSRQSM